MASVPPIDYGSMLTKVDVTPLMQGLQMREQNRAAADARKARGEQIQLARAQFTKEQLEDERYRANIADLATNFSPEKLREVMWKHPEHLDALDKGFQTYTRGQQSDILHTGLGVVGALSANNPDLAADLLRKRRDGLANSGVDTTETDALLKLVKSPAPEDRNRALTMLGIVLTGAVGPEHAAGLMENLGIGAKAEATRRDDDRADRTLTETERHNRVMEGQGSARVAVSQAASARADRKAAGGARGGAGGAAPASTPSSIATVGGKSYVKRGGKWYAQ